MRGLFILLMILPFLFAACKKEEVPLTLVPDHILAMMPYQKGDSFTFESNTGDFLVAKVTMEEDEERLSNCINCPVSSRNQYFIYKLQVGGQTLGRFELLARASEVMFFSLFSPSSGYTSGIGCDVHLLPPNPVYDCNRSNYVCLNMVNLGGIDYANVLQQTIPDNPSIQGEFRSVYFSKEIGLIGFEFDNQVAYFLRP